MTSYAVTSEVYDSALIVHILIETVDLGDPRPEPGTTWLRREGTVGVRLADVLKGSVSESVGDVVEVPAVVRVVDGFRMRDVWGLWSLLPLDPGASLVAFCDGTTSSLAQALTDEHCQLLTPAGPVLGDLRLARGLQRRHPTADMLLTEAERQRAEAGALFARYVWVSARTALRASLVRFDRLMAVAEDAGTRLAAQEAYLVAVYEDVTFTGEFTDGHRARLARAMMRSALDPRLGELRSRLLKTYLPNLVTAPLPNPLPPEAVFPSEVSDAQGEEAAALRDAVLTELNDPRDPATTSPALRAWLTEPQPNGSTGGAR
jgi:hypothetical protein